MTQVPNLDLFLGRKEELRSLLAALHERESRLVWGPSDAGKSALIRKLFSELTESERRGCICWKGPAGKHLKARKTGVVTSGRSIRTAIA